MFVLGALPKEDLLQLREHLSHGCEACRERLKEAARTVYLLSLSAKPVSPAPKVKADLLRLVKNK